MTYDDVLKYINSLPPFIPVKREDGRPLFDLDSVRELALRLGNPQDRLKLVHIAGTNGKGSVALFLSEILTESGYKTAAFTSPYHDTIREQTMIDGELISEEDFSDIFEEVIFHCENMRREGLKAPSEFEMDVAASFLYFYRCGCDICIIETGLGGEFDATNIISSPLLSIFTEISLDHLSVLGERKEDIAAVKAGIIKRGCDCLSVPQDRSVLDVLKQKANEMNAGFEISKPFELVHINLYGLSFTREYEGTLEEFKTGVGGIFQAANASLAIDAALSLKAKGYDHINKAAVKKALMKVKRPGRFEVLSTDPVVIADGAHNYNGACALLKSLEAVFLKNFERKKSFIFIAGVLADKEYEKIADIISPYAFKIICVTPENVRALPAQSLAEVFIKRGADAISADNKEAALQFAREYARKEDMPVIILGSLYL